MKSQPQVTILLALYRPVKTFLKEQLESLANQDYDNIDILIWDDCPDEDCEKDIAVVLPQSSYTYIKCTENLGYVKAFEHMTSLAKGDYIAFCDQDDIWEPQKISRSVNELLAQDALLATSDRMIIDENDKVVIPSFRQHSKFPMDTWKTGEDISSNAVFTCYALGMTIVMRTDVAKMMIPFSPNTGHDKWVTMGAAAMGKVIFIEEPLQRYRRHGDNISGTFNGITSKSDYYTKRVDAAFAVAHDLIDKFPNHPQKERILNFANARKNQKIIQLFKLRAIAPQVAFFEILLKFTPAWLFKLILNKR